MQNWLFQANERYNLIEEVPPLIGKREWWHVKNHRNEMHEGDTAIFWQAGSEAGVYAIGKLLGEPYEKPPTVEGTHAWQVDVEYSRLLETPILKTDLIDDPVLQHLQVLRMPFSANPFRVTDEEWRALNEAIAGKRTVPKPEFIEASIRLEQDIEDHLIDNLDWIEPGLKYVDRQVIVDVGRIDILAEDANGKRVVIEVKVGDADRAAVGQIASYLGWYARDDGEAPRGILIASGFPEKIRYAATAVHNLTLITYKVQFSFEQATIAGKLATVT